MLVSLGGWVAGRMRWGGDPWSDAERHGSVHGFARCGDWPSARRDAVHIGLAGRWTEWVGGADGARAQGAPRVPAQVSAVPAGAPDA